MSRAARRARPSALAPAVEQEFERYFARTAESPASRTSIVVVTHAIPGVIPFLEAASKVARIEFVVPKPSSIVRSEIARVESRFPVQRVQRGDVGAVVQRLASALPYSESLAILDMGGYFADGGARYLHETLGDRFLGVVEDTENGVVRYESSNVQFPVFSAARSQLKLAEDYVIGEWIVQSADTLVRKYGRTLRGRRSAVLGYGKVGSSIAQHLRLRGSDVVVFDRSAARMLLADAHQFGTSPKGDAIRLSDYVFCATGNGSVGSSDLRWLVNDQFVFTATSADDELDLDLNEPVVSVTTDVYGTQVWSDATARFRLANGGQAINFMYPGGFAEYILPVQAELLASLKLLIFEKNGPGIWELPVLERENIAKMWLESFRHRGS